MSRKTPAELFGRADARAAPGLEVVERAIEPGGKARSVRVGEVVKASCGIRRQQRLPIRERRRGLHGEVQTRAVHDCEANSVRGPRGRAQFEWQR